LTDLKFNIDQDLDILGNEQANQTLEVEDDFDNLEHKSSNLSLDFDANFEDFVDKMANQSLEFNSDLDQLESQMTENIKHKLAHQLQQIQTQEQHVNQEIKSFVSGTDDKLASALNHLDHKLDLGMDKT
jgi:hypothetical protein